MIKPKHKTLLDQQVTATISVSMPILTDLPDAGFPLNVGTLTLKLGKKNFVLDSIRTTYENKQKKGSTLTFDTLLEIDLDTIKRNDEYNYNLTEADLNNPKLKGEFFCTDEDFPDGFDFDKALIHCIVRVNEAQYRAQYVVKVTFE
jgi:hypothetical protein